MWQVALELAVAKPLFAYSVASYPGVLNDPSLGIPAGSAIWLYTNVHNQFLNLLLETGIVGLPLFCLLLATAFVTGSRL